MPEKDSFADQPTLDQQALDRLVRMSQNAEMVPDPLLYWTNVTRFVDSVIPLEKLSGPQEAKLNHAIKSAVPGETLQTIGQRLQQSN